MPHLTLALDPVRGPILPLPVSVSALRANALRDAGLAVPPAITVNFLVDTGAACTAVDEAAIVPLGLAPTGHVRICTPTTGGYAESRYTYDVGITLYHSANSRVFESHSVIATDFRAQSIGGLLGRDVLASCLLVYDGSSQNFSLAF